MFRLFFIPVKDIIFHILSREGSVQSHPARWFSSKLLYHRLKGSKHFLWVLRSLPQRIALFQLVWFELRPVDSPPSSILGQISGDSLSGGSKKQIPSRISTPTWSQGGSPLLQNLLNTSCALGIGEGGKLKVGSAIISPAERLGSVSRQPGSPAYFPIIQPVSPARSLCHLHFLPFTPGRLPSWPQSTFSCLQLFSS